MVVVSQSSALFSPSEKKGGRGGTMAPTHPKKVFILPKSVEIPTTERQSAKILRDDIQKVLRRRQAQRDIGRIGNLGVVGGFHLWKYLG